MDVLTLRFIGPMPALSSGSIPTSRSRQLWLRGALRLGKVFQIKQKPRMGWQMAVCSTLVLSIGLVYHTWLVKVFLEPGENLSDLFRPAQVCHCVGDGIVVSELQQG